jgi:hypothetical protein
MPTDSRIEENGQRIDYTCANRRFKTNRDKGEPHGVHDSSGSVFREPLAGSQDEDDTRYGWSM